MKVILATAAVEGFMENTEKNSFEKFGLEVSHGEVEIGKTYPIYGMITKVFSAEVGTSVTKILGTHSNRRALSVRRGFASLPLLVGTLILGLRLLCPSSAEATSVKGPESTRKMVGRCALQALDGAGYAMAIYDYNRCLENAETALVSCHRDAIQNRINCFRMKIGQGIDGATAQRACGDLYAVEEATCESLYETAYSRCAIQFQIDMFDVLLPSVGPFGPGELLQGCSELAVDPDGRPRF